MRVSESALALFTRSTPDGTTAYLTQWNERWRAYSLIGGHRRKGETFRDCCVREVTEELRLMPEIDFQISDRPVTTRLEYKAFSKSAGAETRYAFELFSGWLRDDAVATRVLEAPENCWVSEAEVRAGRTLSGKAIDAQVARSLDWIAGRESAE
ncbi:NUDIX domain-containing protein [Planctomyces sp. SH-PL14]|uniref:NUDIX domain-containing protein n=1 Tax=Planctomyces sp. SH-PL14 TaxID=1632864 RepID=UPI00078C427A|nr:NUDIX hydrolase [Planctomyces sp. SH-PL14]AMV18449.1 hypothetical protein VT03_11195 [Planctomyces sp. SH-PL14]